MAGMLYLCATPIGNLEDITFRVLRTLKEVDLIAAEDTRNSQKLLNHFDIHTPMTSYHEYNKYDKADIFGFDIADVSGSIRLFLDVMKKLGIKLDGDGLYEEFQRIYDEAVNRDVDKGKAEDKIWNKGRGR